LPLSLPFKLKAPTAFASTLSDFPLLMDASEQTEICCLQADSFDLWRHKLKVKAICHKCLELAILAVVANAYYWSPCLFYYLNEGSNATSVACTTAVDFIHYYHCLLRVLATKFLKQLILLGALSSLNCSSIKVIK